MSDSSHFGLGTGTWRKKKHLKDGETARDLTLCSRCPVNWISLRWRNSRSPCASRRTSDHPPLRPSLLMMIPREVLGTTFFTGLSVASQEHLRHLVSPNRLAFCSAPLPDLRTMVRRLRATGTGYQELQTCLRRTLVADPVAEPESEPGSGSVGGQGCPHCLVDGACTSMALPGLAGPPRPLAHHAPCLHCRLG